MPKSADEFYNISQRFKNPILSCIYRDILEFRIFLVLIERKKLKPIVNEYGKRKLHS